MRILVLAVCFGLGPVVGRGDEVRHATGTVTLKPGFSRTTTYNPKVPHGPDKKTGIFSCINSTPMGADLPGSPQDLIDSITFKSIDVGTRAPGESQCAPGTLRYSLGEKSYSKKLNCVMFCGYDLIYSSLSDIPKTCQFALYADRKDEEEYADDSPMKRRIGSAYCACVIFEQAGKPAILCE